MAYKRQAEKRHAPRKKFAFYMRVFDDETEETVGHLVDISALGIRLETPDPLPSGREYRLRMELTPEVSDTLFMFFAARSKWCRPDEIMPNLYHVGFEITQISPHDREIYQRLLERYGE